MQSISAEKFFATGELEAYRKAAGYLIRTAENDFFISLSASTKGKIYGLSRAVFSVDDYFDSLVPSAKESAVSHILGYLKEGGTISLGAPDLERSLMELKLMLNELSPERKEKFLNTVKDIFKCAKILSSTKRPAEFVRARKKEGVSTSNLFLSMFPELDKHQKFSLFFRKVAAFGNYVDSIVDLSADRKAGEVAVARPVSMYFRLSARVIGGAVSIVAQYPNKRALLRYASRFLGYMRELKVTGEESPSFPGNSTAHASIPADRYRARL